MPTISPQVTPYYGGGQVVNPANVLQAQAAPSSVFTEDKLGTILVDYVNGNIYGLAKKDNGQDTWVLMGGAAGAISAVNGTANQITANTAGNIVTLSIPATFIAPGSIASTSTITAATGLTVTAGGATVSAGNIVATLGNINATAGSMSAGTSITAGTTLTATLGNITATNGNLVLTAAGNKMVRTSVATNATAGANSIGSATLVGGTVTIATTAVTASSLIQLWRQSIGSTGAAALGMLTVGTITAGTSFVINAVQAADATALQASDVSVIGWEIIN